MAADRVMIRNLSRRVLRFGSPQTGTLVKVPAAAPTGSGAPVFVDVSDPTVKRDLYRNLGSYILESGASSGSSTRIAKAPLAGVTATTEGAVGAWQNPENQPIIVTRVVLDVTTQSTGAANVTVKQSATQGGTAITTVGAAQAVGAAGTFGPTTTVVKMGATDWLDFTGSADTTGLVGNVYVHYSIA